MRTYRSVWAVTVLSALALALAVTTAGWVTVVLVAVGTASLLLVVVALAGVLARCLRLWAAHQQPRGVPDPDDPTYRALERRWSATTWEVRSPSVPMQQRLELVAQREWLLDELERRDPRRFESILVRDGWREPQQSGPRAPGGQRPGS